MSEEKRLERECDAEVKSFVDNGGAFVLVTRDLAFRKLFLSVFRRYLGLGLECVAELSRYEDMAATFERLCAEAKRIFLFIEAEMDGDLANDHLRAPGWECRPEFVIAVSGPVQGDPLILLYELGAQDFIIKPVSAAKVIEKIAGVVSRPQAAEGLSGEIRACLEQGDYSRALALSDELIRKHPERPLGYSLKGDALNSMGDNPGAVEAYTRASELSGRFLEPLVKMSGLAQWEEDRPTQIKALKKLDKLSPLNLERKVLLGNVYLRVDRGHEAEEVFQAALKLAARQGRDAAARTAAKVADACMAHSPALAEKYSRMVLESGKGAYGKAQMVLFNKLGIALRKQGRWQEAIKEYRKALELGPGDGVLEYNLSLSLAEGGLFDEAVQHLAKALEINPGFWEGSASTCCNIAVLLAKSGNRDQAREFAQRALDLDPEREKAARLLKELAGPKPATRS
ncbi:MAG: tetratricopeptide repeat protein [Desulfovibrionaceae bacterium]|nr:tetratricopeptide repeat protein [Desulfovibrionaceae bacterium]